MVGVRTKLCKTCKAVRGGAFVAVCLACGLICAKASDVGCAITNCCLCTDDFD